MALAAGVALAAVLTTGATTATHRSATLERACRADTKVVDLAATYSRSATGTRVNASPLRSGSPVSWAAQPRAGQSCASRP
jgi:hypothetical protein